MNKGIVGVLSFAVGGTIGFMTANKFLKDKYEQLVQDEIDSVKAAFRKEHPSRQAHREGTPSVQQVHGGAGLHEGGQTGAGAGSADHLS